MTTVTISLARVMIELFEKMPKTFNEVLVTGTVHRSIMLSIYRLLVKEGTLLPIEEITPEQKNEIWNRAKTIIAGRMNKEQCIEVIKSIHAMELISKQ